MVMLELRFAGLNVFTKHDTGVLVHVTDARQRTSGPDRKLLEPHEPVLIVEKGSLHREGKDGFPWPTKLVLNNEEYDYAALWNNQQISLAASSQQPRLTIPPDWLPHLGDVDSRVHKQKPRKDPVLGATFRLDRGVFTPGTEVSVISWQGEHIGVGPKTLRMWTTLECLSSDEDEFKLRKPFEDWVLRPPLGEDRIVAWVGNLPIDRESLHHERHSISEAPEESAEGAHIARRTPQPIWHFKWLYVHTPMKAQPTDLAYPLITRPDQLKIFIPMTSTYCPDGQYP